MSLAIRFSIGVTQSPFLNGNARKAVACGLPELFTAAAETLQRRCFVNHLKPTFHRPQGRQHAARSLTGKTRERGTPRREFHLRHDRMSVQIRPAAYILVQEELGI